MPRCVITRRVHFSAAHRLWNPRFSEAENEEGQFFDKTKPERCYATAEEARRDGCRWSRR